MSENFSIRCPACRGAKKVAGLGGMICKCRTCTGTGSILATDKPVTVVVEPPLNVAEVVKAVSDTVPVSEPEPLPVKVDGKRATYQRKKTA